MMLWLQFLLCAGVITLAGSRLSKYAQATADVTNLGRTWIGVLMLATVTSLPELITGTTAVAVHNLPDIAAGDVLGSCMINLLIIAVLDFLNREKPILAYGEKTHILNGALGIALLAIVNVSLLLRERVPAIGWVGIYTPLILICYVAAMRMVYKAEHKSNPGRGESDDSAAGMSKGRVFTLFGINAAIVIGAATWLPQLGERIAEKTGLEQSFVGTLFVAFSTSLPEFVVTYAALRMGAVPLALGNLFGSNLFNVGALAIEDIAYTRGPLLSAVSSSHATTVNSAILMTSIALAGMISGRSSRRFRFGWASLLLMVVFAIGSALNYLLATSKPGTP